MAGLTIEEIEKIRNLRKEGKSLNEIAELTKHSKKTIEKVIKLTDEEIEDLKAQQIQEKSLKPIPSAKTRILRIYEDKLLKKASLTLVRREEIADYVEANITPLAQRLNQKEEDIIDFCFRFTLQNFRRIQELEKENQKLRLFSEKLLEASKPYWDFSARKKEKLNEILTLIKESAKHNQKVPEQVFDVALRVILAEEENV